MSAGLDRKKLSSIEGHIGLCQTCRHSRASHGQRAARCYSTHCTCTGWVAP